MNISIFGMGYVGVVSAACLAMKGHNIIGVDTNELKVQSVNEGTSPIVEKDLPEMLADGRQKNRIRATSDAYEAISNSELSLICVGTPSKPNGSLETVYLEQVCEEIGQSLRYKDGAHILVFRSTMLPGTMKSIVIPKLEQVSGKKQGVDFFVAFNPEFLRESTAVHDFFNPPKTVIGTDTEEIADKILEVYEDIPGPRIKTRIEIAEMVKYVDNNFHALKITFANEVGRLCKSIGLDSYAVMDIFMQDTKLNISTAYLKPGFAFGGSCLPKDLRAITYMARMNDVETPLLNSLMQSNQIQIIDGTKKIMSFGKRKIGVAGFSFKEGADDLRESPVVEVIETLIGKGYDLKLYDRNVSLSKLIGANKKFIHDRIPHIASLMVDSLEELLSDREVIVIGNNDKEFVQLVENEKPDQIIFELTRVGDCKHAKGICEGVSW